MNFKPNYSEEDWNSRKQYYIINSQQIVLPTDPTPIELKQLNAMNSNLLAQAYMDKATISELLERTSKLKSLYEAECITTIDWDELSKDRSAKDKLLSKEKDAYVEAFIRKKTSSDNGIDIFQKEIVYSSRHKFIETVIYHLKDNSYALNSLYSLLKLETMQLGSMV